MPEVVDRLRERRGKVWEEAKSLADTAADENRAFAGEEEQKWQQLNGELDALDKRIKNILDGEKRAADTERQFAEIRGEPEPQTPEGERRKSTNAELRKFLAGEGPRAIELRFEQPIDFRALAMAKALGVEQRASLLTSGSGGNLVPTDFLRRLVEHLIEVSGVMRAGPTVLNTTSGEQIQVPKTTAHSTAAIVGEGTAIAQNDATFGQVTLGSFKYGNLTQVSRELVTDSGVDLEGYLARDAGRAIGNALGDHLINGTGTGQPRGVLTDATAGVTGGTGVGGAFTGDNLIDLFFSVIEPYRMSDSCVWLMRDATLAVARKLKTTDGQYLWQPGLQAGVPDLLLGKRVVTDPFMPAVGLSNESVAFGDFSTYFVRTVASVRFERSEDFAFDTDMVAFRSLYRADGALIDLTGSIKTFTGGAS